MEVKLTAHQEAYWFYWVTEPEISFHLSVMFTPHRIGNNVFKNTQMVLSLTLNLNLTQKKKS